MLTHCFPSQHVFQNKGTKTGSWNEDIMMPSKYPLSKDSSFSIHCHGSSGGQVKDISQQEVELNTHRLLSSYGVGTACHVQQGRWAGDIYEDGPSKLNTSLPRLGQVPPRSQRFALSRCQQSVLLKRTDDIYWRTAGTEAMKFTIWLSVKGDKYRMVWYEHFHFPEKYIQ